jgi:16S rRNA (cytidine1402-2'-O)-methyltransferase
VTDSATSPDEDPPGEAAAGIGGDPPARGAEPGLHVVSTPIGAARDITLRALDILATADLLLAEDTRSLRRLMEIHGLRLAGRPLWSYHDHNGARMRPRVLAALAQGKAVALVSDAGTPLVADPGFQLVRAAIDAGHPARAAPGASALLAALAVAGLPTDRFAFLGFAPTQGGARSRFLAEALALPMTVVIYESPRRVHRLLGECAQNAGERPAALCRELTKRHEEVIRGSLTEIVGAIAGREVKGEVVMVIGGAPASAAVAGDDALEAALREALSRDSLRVAVDMVAQQLGLPRRQVYQRALTLRSVPEEEEEG